MMQDTYAHAPAMSPQEAALLTAGHFTMPLDESHFVPVRTENDAVRRGSAAGRAILHAAGVNLPGVQPMRCGRRITY